MAARSAATGATSAGAATSAAITRRDRVVAAAADQFIRYGFARTTMGGIARAAEISRPALYLLFPGKEEVFEAAVRELNLARMAEIEAALGGCARLEEQLLTACRLWLVEVFELQCTTPDAGDMDDLSFPVVVEVHATLEARIAALLTNSRLSLPAPAEDLARVLVFGVRGFGATARDTADMLAMTRLHVDLLVRALSSSLPASAP